MARNDEKPADADAADQGRARDERGTYSAQDVSQGEIILRTPLRKAVFLGALVVMVLIAVILGVLAVSF